MASTSKLVELFNSYAEANLASASATEFVVAAYENLLGLAGDFSNKDKRVAYWVERLQDGLDRDDFAATFLNLAENTKGDLLTATEFALNKSVIAALESLSESGLTLDSIKSKALETVASLNATITASASSVNEGDTVTYTISDAKASTEYTYTISGVSASDVTGGSLTGTVTTDADGTATFTVSLVEDKTTEGAETLTVVLDGTVATKSISVADTSEDLSLTASSSSVSEGDTITYTVANADASTTYNYTIAGVSASDVSGGSLTGSFTTDANGDATFTVVTLDDNTVEDAETLTVTLDGTDVSAAVTLSDVGSTVGQTFTLTTGDDTSIFGTSGNDTYTATQLTYTEGDLIVDSTTTDNDTLTVTATDDIEAAPSVTAIENVNFNLAAFNASAAGASTQFDIAATNISASTISLDVTQAGSTVTKAALTNVRTGVTVDLSDDFTAVSVSAVDNANITVNTAAAATLSVTDAALGTVGDVTVNAADDLEITDSSNDGDLTATVAGDLDVTAATATTATLTATGAVLVTDLDSVTTLTVSAAGELDGDSTTVNNNGIVTAAALTTLNLSGNGAALEFGVELGEAALTDVAFSGDQDVTLVMAGDEADGLYISNTATGTATLRLDATTTAPADLSDVATSVTIDLADDFNAQTLTIADNAMLTFSETQTDLTIESEDNDSQGDDTVSVTIADDETANSSYEIATDLEFVGMDAVTLTVADTSVAAGGLDIADLIADDADITIDSDVDLDIEAITTTGDVTFTGAGDVDLSNGNIVADSLIATTLSGNLTIGLDDNVATVTGGTGNDLFSISLAGSDYTINGTSGTDTVYLENGLDTSDDEFTLSNIDVISLGGTATMDLSTLSGKSYMVTGDSSSAATLTLVADIATANLGALTIDTDEVDIALDMDTLNTAGTAVNVTGTNGVDVITATGGTGTVTLSLGDGDDEITATGDGNDVLTLGAGNDLVTDAGAGNDTISLGAGDDEVTDAGDGNDTITAGEGADDITAGSGDDTIDLSEDTAAVDTVTFGDAATNGSDTITSFMTGSSSGDILDFTAFAAVTGVADTTGYVGVTSANSSGAVDLAAKVHFISNQGASVDTIAEVQALVTDDGSLAGQWMLADADEAIIFYGNVADGAQTFTVYHVVGGTAATDVWTKIATIGVTDGDAFVAASNFAFAP